MDFGKKIRALSSLFVHLLESQGFITVPAGEQGEEITQTPGDTTKLTQNPYEQEQPKSSLGEVKQEIQGPWKTTRRIMALTRPSRPPGLPWPSRNRTAHKPPQISKISPLS